MSLGASRLGWASGGSPTGEYRPPERPAGGSELESTYWVCGTTGWMGGKIHVKKANVNKKLGGKVLRQHQELFPGHYGLVVQVGQTAPKCCSTSPLIHSSYMFALYSPSTVILFLHIVIVISVSSVYTVSLACWRRVLC